MGIQNKLNADRPRMSRQLVEEASNFLTTLLNAAYSGDDESESITDIIEAKQRKLNEEVTKLQDSLSAMVMARRNFSDDLASIKKIHEATNELYAKRHDQ